MVVRVHMRMWLGRQFNKGGSMFKVVFSSGEGLVLAQGIEEARYHAKRVARFLNQRVLWVGAYK